MATVSTDSSRYPVLNPDLQVSFYYRLGVLSRTYLQEALGEALISVGVPKLDGELARLVSPKHLSRVASFGLRGEVFFPVPSLLRSDPRLIGYYRLLFGFSQKGFYTRGPFGPFKRLEDTGTIPIHLDRALEPLCASLVGTAQKLIDGLGELSTDLVHDLQLLTLGPQLRGSRNTALGQDATQQVFDLIRAVVGDYAVSTTGRVIEILNDSQRTVLVEFSNDPDVRIVELLPSGRRPRVSVEVKGGSDISNVHNRLGEAEKSHQKAKNAGFFEFWTILRSRVDLAQARRESPTTSHFFDLDAILDVTSGEHRRFRELLVSLLGMRA